MPTGEIYSADLVMAARRWADDADVLLLAAEAARNSGVWQVTDGKVSPPEAA